MVTSCHNLPCIFFLSRCGACASVNDSVRIRTDTTLDQDCVLKANVHVCTACMSVSLLTTCLNLNTLPLASIISMRRLTKSYQPDSIEGGPNVKLEGATEGALRSTITFHQHERSFLHFPRVVRKWRCNLFHHNVGLDICPIHSLAHRPIIHAPWLP